MPLFFDNWDDFHWQLEEDDEMAEKISRIHEGPFYVGDVRYEYYGVSHFDEGRLCEGEAWRREDGVIICDLCHKELKEIRDDQFFYPASWTESKAREVKARNHSLKLH
jgi:hypothetical protein